MAESEISENQPPKRPGESFGYKRRLIEPKLHEAKKDLVDSGMEPEGRQFIKTKHIVARKYLEKEAQGQIDQLTGLLNRKGFDNRLGEEVSAMKRDGETRMIFFLDANGLKKINDTLGHEEGDKLLKDIAQRMRETARPSDVFARFGGDEFAAIINIGEEGTQTFFERLNGNFTDEKRGNPISIATGVTMLDPDNPLISLALADAAMYRSKELSKERGENVIVNSNDLTPEEATLTPLV